MNVDNYLRDLRYQLREEHDKQKAMLDTWPRTSQNSRAAEEGALIAYGEIEALMDGVRAADDAASLFELGLVLREAAEGAKRDEERATWDIERSGESDRSFHTGRLGTYAHVLSHMKNQAELFGIPLGELALDGLDPERDLLPEG